MGSNLIDGNLAERLVTELSLELLHFLLLDRHLRRQHLLEGLPAGARAKSKTCSVRQHKHKSIWISKRDATNL